MDLFVNNVPEDLKNCIEYLHYFNEFSCSGIDNILEDCELIISITNRNFEIWIADSLLEVELKDIKLISVNQEKIHLSIYDNKYELFGFR